VPCENHAPDKSNLQKTSSVRPILNRPRKERKNLRLIKINLLHKCKAVADETNYEIERRIPSKTLQTDKPCTWGEDLANLR